MNNVRRIPFEKNNFYEGRLLRASDFSKEQKYDDEKRRFMNSIILGTGVICGFEVKQMDDQTLMIESGVAIDPDGREIILGKPVIKKLCEIAGYNELKTSEASLCMCYAEKSLHPVFGAIEMNQNEVQYDYLQEACDLVLMDKMKMDAEEILQSDETILERVSLFEHEDYRVSLVVPKIVSKGRLFKIVLMTEKRSNRISRMDYSCVLQLSALQTNSGEHELTISSKQVDFQDRGTVSSQEIWITAEQTEDFEGNINVKTGTAVARINEKYVDTIEFLGISLQLSMLPPKELVARQIGLQQLESLGGNWIESNVRIADITISKKNNGSRIEKIEQESIKKYIQIPATKMQRDRYYDFFADQESRNDEKVENEKKETNIVSNQESNGILQASGVIEIQVDDELKKGDVLYTQEIVHGLGCGNVLVSLAYEGEEETDVEDHTNPIVIYGDPSFFMENSNDVCLVETSVKILQEQGSFQGAIKIKQLGKNKKIRFLWNAIKYPEPEKNMEKEEKTEKTIKVEPATSVMHPKESIQLAIEFAHMEPEEVEFTLMEDNSGEVTENGIYTAPEKEGVFEIKVSSKEYPSVFTYAYVIVK